MRRPGTVPEVAKQKVLSRNKMRDLELRERSSRSLLANVLDLDDDFRGIAPLNHQTTTINNSHSNYNSSFMSSRPNDNHSPMARNSVKYTNTNGGPCPNCTGAEFNAQCTGLRDILKEVQYMTEKIKRDEQFEEDCNDWKFAAMVIDRLCLWLFSIFTTVSTCAILFSAPHLFS